MPKRSSKTKFDVNLLAKSIVNDFTSEKMVDKAVEEGKNPAAVLLGRLGGLKGGKVRAARLSVERRSEIATKAAKTRWKNEKLKAK
ncbi:MAG: hypothetical protein ABSB91_01990 [Sedimentisphaerales bacterium]|jgi:hypothetical protein